MTHQEILVQPTAVTIFPDRAQVTCHGTGDLTTEHRQLFLTGLPLSLETASVRVSGAGTARVKIMSVDIQRQFFTEATQEKVQALEAALEAAEAELNQTKDAIAGWEAHGRYLEGMRSATKSYAAGLAKGQTQINDHETVVSFLQAQDTEMRDALRTLAQQATEQVALVNKLRQELKQIQTARPRQAYRAVVDIEVLEGGSFTPEIRYLVSAATWKPLYDIRLESVKGNPQQMALQFTMLAEITQKTGQDWQGVSLTVSTARPALNQQMPELFPWFIDEQPSLVRAAKMSVMQPMAVPESSAPAPMMAMAAEADRVAEIMETTIEDSGAAVRFVVPGRSDIPNDGSPHKLTLTRSPLDPEIKLLCVPKQTDAVFRQAIVDNGTGAPLLPGQVSLFVDDAFIGQTEIEFTPQGGEIELWLGAESGVSVKRELKRRDVDKKFLSDQRRIVFGYEIELTNHLDTAVTVNVEDHIPVSRHDQIKVKLQKVEPAAQEKSELNQLTWQCQLAPKGAQQIVYEFTVEHPRSLQIRGLP